MGKVEDMRALREQLRQARTVPDREPPATRPTPRAGAGRTAASVPSAPTGTDPMVAAEDVAEPGPSLDCGHRSMGNKVCTRPRDHPEKNHRYSTR